MHDGLDDGRGAGHDVAEAASRPEAHGAHRTRRGAVADGRRGVDRGVQAAGEDDGEDERVEGAEEGRVRPVAGAESGAQRAVAFVLFFTRSPSVSTLDRVPFQLTIGTIELSSESGADGAGDTSRDAEADGRHGRAAGDDEAARGEGYGGDGEDDGEDDGGRGEEVGKVSGEVRSTRRESRKIWQCQNKYIL